LLEAGKASEVSFSQPTVELLQLVSTQAAQSIRNAQKYEVEARRVLELAGLAELFRSLASYVSKAEIFKRLVDLLSPLFDTEIVGFVLFDEVNARWRTILFIGLPKIL
jgi:GAF domain-containing protein